MSQSADLWAWRHEEDAPAAIDISGEEVTAVLVVHNGAAWLDRALAAIGNLNPRPAYLLGVDAGSYDRSGEIMRTSGLFTTVVQTSASGFGEAAREALHDHDPVRRHGSRATGDRWFWFLHDDCEVAPDALGELLRQGVAEPDTAILGPKLLQHDRRAGAPRVASVGLSLAADATCDRHVEDDEIDQHQHRRTDVLGVDTCGLLIRRDTFIELGGFAPELPVFTDGIDLGWRAVEAGHRVRTCPTATIVHRGVGHTGRRHSPVIGPRPGATERLLAMRTVAAHRHGPLAWLGSAGLLVGCVLRALGFLLAKAPGRAADEMRAAGAFLVGGETRALRGRVDPPDAAARSRARHLRPGPLHGLATALDAMAQAAALRWRETFGSSSPTLDELTGDDFSGTEHRRRTWISPIPVVFVLTIIGAIAAARNVIGPGRLTGPQLLPSAETLGAAWATFTDPIAGASGIPAAPWTAWVALGSTLTFGQPEWFVTLVLLGAVPLSFATAQVWLRHVSVRPMVRALAGLAHALVPVLTGAVGRGALGVVIVAIGLPLLATAVRDLFTSDPTTRDRARTAETWRPAWATGLALSVLVPFCPTLFAPLAVAVVACAAVDSPARLRRAAVAVGVPVVVLFPWVAAVIGGNARLLLGPDAALGSWAIVPWWQTLLGRTPGAGLPAFAISAAAFALLWAVAIVALLVALDRSVVRVAWAVAAASVVLAIMWGRLLFRTLPVGSQVRLDLTAWVIVCAGALVTTAAVAADTLVRHFTRTRRRTPHPILRLTAATTAVTLVAALLGWTWWATPTLAREEASDLPPFVVNAQTGPTATRTLAIDLTGDVPRFQLVDGPGPRLGRADRGLAHEGSQQWPELTRSVVAAMLGGSADEAVGATLQELAVGHVWVLGASDTERIQIGNTPGLGSGSGQGDWVVWTLRGVTARATLELPGGPRVLPLDGHRGSYRVPESTGGRLLLSEPPDRRWDVRLDGVDLQHHAEGEQLVVDLPARGGELTVALKPLWPRWLVWAQAALLLLAAVLALPTLAGMRARRRTDAEPSGDPDVTMPRRDAAETPARRDAAATPEPQVSDETLPRRVVDGRVGEGSGRG